MTDPLTDEYEGVLDQADGLIGRMMDGATFADRQVAAREAGAWLNETDNFAGLSERLWRADRTPEAMSLYDLTSPDSVSMRLSTAIGRSIQTDPYADLGLPMDQVDPTAAGIPTFRPPLTSLRRHPPRRVPAEPPAPVCQTCQGSDPRAALRRMAAHEGSAIIGVVNVRTGEMTYENSVARNFSGPTRPEGFRPVNGGHAEMYERMTGASPMANYGRGGDVVAFTVRDDGTISFKSMGVNENVHRNIDLPSDLQGLAAPHIEREFGLLPYVSPWG